MAITPIHDFLARRIVNPGRTDAPFISLQKGKLYPKYGSKAAPGGTDELAIRKLNELSPPPTAEDYAAEIVDVSDLDITISDSDLARIESELSITADDVNFDADGNLIIEEEEE